MTNPLTVIKQITYLRFIKILNGNELRKEAITTDGNEYYLLVDTAIDNPDVLRETKRLRKETEEKHNVHILNLHSFEIALLSFELLEQWVFAENDDLKDARKELLQARTLLNKVVSSNIDVDELAAFKEAFHNYHNKNSEQIAASLLYGITRNTGFETDKSALGRCFINNCCDWVDRKDNDIFGLNEQRLNTGEKARMLVERSVLQKAFEGL